MIIFIIFYILEWEYFPLTRIKKFVFFAIGKSDSPYCNHRFSKWNEETCWQKLEFPLHIILILDFFWFSCFRPNDRFFIIIIMNQYEREQEAREMKQSLRFREILVFVLLDHLKYQIDNKQGAGQSNEKKIKKKILRKKSNEMKWLNEK